MNIDRTIYSAFNDCGKHGIEAVVDPSMTHAELVERIRTGDFGFDAIVKVIAFNPVEGWSRDVTDDIFNEAQILLDAAE